MQFMQFTDAEQYTLPGKSKPINPAQQLVVGTSALPLNSGPLTILQLHFLGDTGRSVTSRRTLQPGMLDRTKRVTGGKITGSGGQKMIS